MKLEGDSEAITITNKNYRIDIHDTFVVVTRITKPDRRPKKEIFCYTSGKISTKVI